MQKDKTFTFSNFLQVCGIILQKYHWQKVLGGISYWKVLHCISLQSTSFIEEEHQTIYFIVSSIFFVKLINSKLDSNNSLGKALLGLLILRMARAMNQTGDKWSHLPDVGDWLKTRENIIFLIGIHSISIFMLIYWNWQTTGGKNWFQKICTTIVYGLIFIQKITDLHSFK